MHVDEFVTVHSVDWDMRGPYNVDPDLHIVSGNARIQTGNYLETFPVEFTDEGGGVFSTRTLAVKPVHGGWKSQLSTFILKMAVTIASFVESGVSTIALCVVKEAIAHTNKAITEEEMRVHRGTL